jgi:hypothetical protein
MKKDIKNVQASIRARLQNKAKETNRPFSEVLQYYGMERFLYRFSRSQYADKFILKGALMFTVWQVPQRRTTLDIDFSSKQWLMMRQFDFDGLKLVEALKRTFRHRKTSLPQHKPLFAEEIYDEKSDRQTLWKAFLRKGDIKHAPEKLSTTARETEKFLIKPLDTVNKSRVMNEEWKAPGPWE